MGGLRTDGRGGGCGSRGRCRPVGVFGLAVVCSLFGVVCGCLWGGAPALAATGHEFVSEMREAPVGSALEEPGAVAVDRASGRVFVADRGRGVVDVFSSTGEYVAQFGEGVLEAQAVAVDEASGDVYVAEPSGDVIDVFKPDGTGGYELLCEWVGVGAPGGEFGEVAAVAVDNSSSASDPSAGDVYVVDRGGVASEMGVVDVFRPRPAGPGETREGEFVRVLTGVRLQEPNGVAVSAATGKVYVADSVKGVVDVFGSAGSFEGEITGRGSPQGSFSGKEKTEEGNVTAVAVDEASGDLLVAEGERRVVGELDAAGEWVGWVTGTPAGGFGDPQGVVVGASGDVYVADGGLGVVDVFGPGVVVAGVVTKAAKEVKGTTAVELKGAVDGDGTPVRYHFEWGESASYYGSSTPVVEGAGAGEEEATAVLTGLKAGTTYYYRLVGENENGLNCGVGWALRSGPPVQSSVSSSASVACQLPPPVIDSESVAEVSSTAATLQAEINPAGHDTSYQFEYGSASCETAPASCTEVPQAPVDVGSGVSDVPGSMRMGGLEPGTTYFYRVLATNSLGVSEGVQHTFTTQPPATAFALPDGRAWEMVSPPEKHGAAIEALTREGGVILASEDGDALTYVTAGAIGEEVQGNRTPEEQQVLATRTPEGWSSQDIATPSAKAEGISAGSPPEYQFFTPDLSLALVAPWGQTPFAEPPLVAGVTQKTLYLRDDATGAFQPLISEANVPPGTEFGGSVAFAGATPDLSHVLIRSGVTLTEPSVREPSPAPGLYEWAGGRLQFVSELPNGTPALEPELGDRHVAANAISSDGSRVIWSSKEEQGEGQHLYMRDTLTGETIQLDAAQGVAEPQTGSARFQTASSDGSRVFFTDEQRLTTESSTSTEPTHEAADLYECEIVEENGKLACRLRDLTVDHQRGGHAAVQGFLLGASEDGASVYLVAQGVLARNADGNGEKARAGAENLYELDFSEASGEWQRTFIAVLSVQDGREWEGAEDVNTSYLTARVSPNGRYLAFMSAASPTGYDNVDQNSGERDEEVYLYDSASASLRCVSCDPTGARPVGVLDTVESGEGLGLLVDRREIWLGDWLAGSIPGWTARSIDSALYQSRYLSNEGRLFFNSPDDLTPQASNHKEDVYEYEPSGVGSCESVSGGCVALISSGSSPNESAFLEATPSGNDVFFLTAAPLLSPETESGFNIYDARVCTPQSPCLTPPSPAPAGCGEADACRPASPSQQAPAGPSGSATFSGPGNLLQPPPGKKEVKGVKTSVKPLTRAQKLANALEACKSQHPHSKAKRRACEAHARKLYAPRKKAGKK
jgi:DNA-binding beta-propeller fold protein YncE